MLACADPCPLRVVHPAAAAGPQSWLLPGKARLPALATWATPRGGSLSWRKVLSGGEAKRPRCFLWTPWVSSSQIWGLGTLCASTLIGIFGGSCVS